MSKKTAYEEKFGMGQRRIVRESAAICRVHAGARQRRLSFCAMVRFRARNFGARSLGEGSSNLASGREQLAQLVSCSRPRAQGKEVFSTLDCDRGGLRKAGRDCGRFHFRTGRLLQSPRREEKCGTPFRRISL